MAETYARIPRVISTERKQYAQRIHQLLTLRIEEDVDAVVVVTEGNQYLDPQYRMTAPREMPCYCSGLVVSMSSKHRSCDADEKTVKLKLIHFSVGEELALAIRCASFGRNSLQTTSYGSHQKVAVEPLPGKLRHIPISTNAAFADSYEVLSLVVGFLTVLVFLMNAIGKCNKATDAFARMGCLTYTCLYFYLIKAYYGDLHASHPYPPSAIPFTTDRSNPAHARRRRRSVDCSSSIHLLGQLVRSLIFLDREEGRRSRADLSFILRKNLKISTSGNGYVHLDQYCEITR